MVSPIAQINQNRRLSSGVTFAPAIGQRARLAPVIPINRGQPMGGDVADRLGAAADSILSNPAYNVPANQGGGGLKDTAVHGLGWLLGNPVSRTVLKPLEALQYPMAAIVGAERQFLDTAAAEQLNKALAQLPGVKYSPISSPDYQPGWQWGELWGDIKNKTGAGTSIVEPIMGPEGTDRNIWARRAAGFALDVASDPLMKLGGGTEAAAGLESRWNYLNKLLDAQKAAGLEAKTTTEAADLAAEWARLGGTGAAEAEAATRAAAEAAARRVGELGGDQAIDLMARRGVNLGTPEQLAAMGMQQHAIRWAGEPIENIVRRFAGERAGNFVGRGSEASSRAMSRFLSPGKELWSRTAGEALRSVPMGVARQALKPATERLIKGEGAMSREVALRAHDVNQIMRVAKGDFRTPALAFHHQLAQDLKEFSKEERAYLVRVAEETGVENATTKMAPQMIETIKDVYRKAMPDLTKEQLDNLVPELQPWRLPNGEMSRYVMPHVLSRDAFRFFTRLRKGQNPLVDFIRRDLGIHDQDLLEETGFLQRRLFRPNADGSPQTFKIGQDEVTINTGSTAELEDKLGGLLRKHGFEGNLYESDPVEAWRRYIKSTEKDVAVRVGKMKGTEYGIEGWRKGDKLPKAWDPYGREIQMLPAEGETDPRYVRGKTTEQRPALAPEYEWAEDEAATKARNQIITEGGEKGPTQQVLNEYGETAAATRENLAQSIENTREYTSRAFKKVEAEAARRVEKLQAIVNTARGRVDKLETEYLELLKESSANEQLKAVAEGKIHGVRSVTPKRIKAAQAKRLADIAESLQAERDNLQNLQRAMDNALKLTDMAEQKAALDRVDAIYQNVEDAKAALEKEREAATRGVQRRIEREARNGRDIHMISDVERADAQDILDRGPNSPAAQRHAELQDRVAKHTANRDEFRTEALRLQEQADRLDERLQNLGRGGRTPEQRARLASSRAEMEAEVASLRRQARTTQNKANTSTRALRDAEQRLADDEWAKAQRTIADYNEQQAQIDNYSDRLTDMKSAQSRLNAAQTELSKLSNEQRMEIEGIIRDEMDAMTAPPPVAVKPVKSLYDILGEDARVRYHEAAPPPESGLSGYHVIEVSSGEDAVGSISWNIETGEVRPITVAMPYQRQGIGTALYDQATQYSEAAGLVKPKHVPGEQTAMGQAWAPEADARIASRPEALRPKGADSPAAKQARQALDTPAARDYIADEQIVEGLQRDIDELTGRPTELHQPAQWEQVGAKTPKEPRANQRWRAYNSRRRKILGEMERIRGEADLSAPPPAREFETESYKHTKPRPNEKLPKYMEQYREKPRVRRIKGREPWWSEEYGPTRPDLTRPPGTRARTPKGLAENRARRLAEKQAELDKVEDWLAKHPQPPAPKPAPHATKLRAKINGKLVRIERTSGIGALGGAEWKITMPGGVEHTFTGRMAEVLTEAERLGASIGREAPDEAVLADLTQRLAQVKERLGAHEPGLAEQVARDRQVLTDNIRRAQAPPSPAPFTQEFPEIPAPTRAELIRARDEPGIEAARQKVERFGAIDVRAENEGIRRDIQTQADERIRGLQGQIETINYEQQRMHSMINDLYQTRMPDPVNDWRHALDNADQARQAHAEIQQYISDYATRQRALDIVTVNARKGAPTGEDLKRVAARQLRPEDAQGLQAAVDDVNKWMTNAGHVLPVGVRKRIEAALMSHEQALAALTTTNDLPASALSKIQREAMNGKLAPVLKAQLRDAYNEIGETGVIMDKNLERMIFGVQRTLDSKLFGPLFTTWTNFFKTYATLTPGFHVRNALSAIFMNASEGVTIREQFRAIKLWKEYRASENPIEWLAKRPEAERNAFRAAFASGAGGQFLEGGVGEARAGAGRATERLFSNPATRLSKRAGEWVEGPQRLALGLHTTMNGGTVNEALSRITRIHFDYSQVSKFDERMKRIIPFWTFMSRNVPLQFTQMWMKPKAYLAYQSAIRNLQLGTEDQPIIPGYISQAGGTYFGVKTPKWAEKIPLIGPPAGMPVVIQPDLPQQRYFDDLQRMTNALSGQGLGQMATNLNPALTVPAEFVSRTDFFTGQHFDPTARVKVGLASLPYAVALSLVGQAQRGADGNWYVDAAALNAVRGLDPNLDRMMRLLPQLGGLESTDKTGASTTARQAESWARWFGAPLRTISKQQQESALRQQYFAEQDRQKLQAAMGG